MRSNAERSRPARVRVTFGSVDEGEYLEQRRREAVNILASGCAGIEFLHPSCDEDGDPCISRTLLDREDARTLLQETASAIPVRRMLGVAVEACEVRANAQAALKIEQGQRPIVAEDVTLALAMRIREALERGDHEIADDWANLTERAVWVAEKDQLSRIAHQEKEGLPPPGFDGKN